MRANDCLTTSMIEVGMRYEKKISFSLEDVETYCRLADDQNSIHRCLEACGRCGQESHSLAAPSIQ